MKYFWTEAERKSKRTSLCFEFQRGEHDGTFWKSDSLILHADLFDEMGLYKLFDTALNNFSYYGKTRVSVDDWNKLLELSKEYGSDIEDLIKELSLWVEDVFKTEKVFYILGV